METPKQSKIAIQHSEDLPRLSLPSIHHSLPTFLIVHPQIFYDESATPARYWNERCAVEREARVRILLDPDHDKDHYITLNDELDNDFIASLDGTVTSHYLAQFLDHNAYVFLGGNHACACVCQAFLSMVKFAEEKQLQNIRIEIPLDGCSLNHGNTMWCASNCDELGYGHPDYYEYFYGVKNGAYMWEMEGKVSYTLRDVASKVFGEPTGPHLWHRKLIRNMTGDPLQATTEQMKYNLEQFFLQNYFSDPRGQPHIKIPYHTEFNENSYVFVLNPRLAEV